MRMGGIETLILRLAREFSARGVPVRVLLVSRDADAGLLDNLRSCASISYLDELVPLPSLGGDRLTLVAGLLRLDRGAAAALLDGIDHVHFTVSLTMMLCAGLVRHARVPPRLTGGIYYQYEFAYPIRASRYCVEVMARHFAFHAAAGRVMFFSETARENIAARTGLDLSSCPLLPIGVDLKRARIRDCAGARRTKAVSVGRLTDIKTYNLYFLDAVAALRRRGVDFEYHVYGDGPALDKVRRRIDELGLSLHVYLHGNLEYSRFGEVIADAGLFVGSGTALIEAAACGVPALIGVESEPDDLSYGYLHEMPGLAYHEQGIAQPKASFAEHVERLLALDAAAYGAMCEASVRKAAEYSIERLVDGWMALDLQIATTAGAELAPGYSRLRYVASLLLDRLAAQFGRGSGFWARYDRSTEAGR